MFHKIILSLETLLKFKARISSIFLLLFVAIIPHESWHLLMNHNDTHCEFNHSNTIEQKHMHCEMLAYEISSFDYLSAESQDTVTVINCMKPCLIIEKNYKSFSLRTFLRGPPQLC